MSIEHYRYLNCSCLIGVFEWLDLWICNLIPSNQDNLLYKEHFVTIEHFHAFSISSFLCIVWANFFLKLEKPSKFYPSSFSSMASSSFFYRSQKRLGILTSKYKQGPRLSFNRIWTCCPMMMDRFWHSINELSLTVPFEFEESWGGHYYILLSYHLEVERVLLLPWSMVHLFIKRVEMPWFDLMFKSKA